MPRSSGLRRDVEAAAGKLEKAGVQAVRGGRLRTSWHVYNTHADVERALDALSG
jgi:selenocysteine lyase/cysteine desulfurase